MSYVFIEHEEQQASMQAAECEFFIVFFHLFIKKFSFFCVCLEILENLDAELWT